MQHLPLCDLLEVRGCHIPESRGVFFLEKNPSWIFGTKRTFVFLGK